MDNSGNTGIEQCTEETLNLKTQSMKKIGLAT